MGVSSIAEFTEDVEKLRELLESVGRPMAGMSIARRCYVVVDRDPRAARQRHEGFFQAAYGDPTLADRALFTSSLDEVRDRIGRLGQAGATDLIMSPLERPDEHLDELSQLL